MDYYLSNKLPDEIMEEVDSYLEGSKKANDFHLLMELKKIKIVQLTIKHIHEREKTFEESKKKWPSGWKKKHGHLNYDEYYNMFYTKGGKIKMKKKYW